MRIILPMSSCSTVVFPSLPSDTVGICVEDIVRFWNGSEK